MMKMIHLTADWTSVWNYQAPRERRVRSLAKKIVSANVVETGGFSAAARQLRVGQPAVSKTVALLVERLQVRLLIRSTHGLAPAEAGQRYFERARAALAEADEAELAARASAPPWASARRCSSMSG